MIPPACRDPNKLSEEMRRLYALFSERMALAGIAYILTETRRSEQRQRYLWDSGRGRPGPILTWTLKSPHIDGNAFDILILRDGKVVKDGKDPLYAQAGKIGQEVGLQWGITLNGRHCDEGHFQTCDD